MDRAFGQMSDETFFSQGDAGYCIIIREHRDHHVPVAGTGKIGRLTCAELDERAAFSGTAIEYAHIVSGPYQIGGHRCAHVSESNKSKFHIIISL